MSKFDGYFAGQSAAFDGSLALHEQSFSSAVGKLRTEMADVDRRADAAESESLMLRQELARTKSLLKTAEAGKAEMLGILSTLTKIAAKQDSHGDPREVEAEADRHLLAIRNALAEIAKHDLGKTDVFVSHLLGEMENLAAVATEAASKSILRVTEHHFRGPKCLLDAFGASERVVRYTWRVNPAERLFSDPVWRKHFELTSSLAVSHAIQEIRTMLIVESRNDFDAPRMQKLLEFLAGRDGLTAKIVLSSDYEAFAADNAIPAACIEFGIYGDRLLYQADSYTPVSVGSWSKDAIEIGRFGKFFDVLWNHAIAANNPLSPSLKVTLSQLMTADEAAGSKPNGVGEIVDRLHKEVNAWAS